MIKKLKEGATPPPKACKICSANFQETFNHQARVFHGEGFEMAGNLTFCLPGLACRPEPPAVQKDGCISFTAACVGLSLCLAGLASQT